MHPTPSSSLLAAEGGHDGAYHHDHDEDIITYTSTAAATHHITMERQASTPSITPEPMPSIGLHRRASGHDSSYREEEVELVVSNPSLHRVSPPTITSSRSLVKELEAGLKKSFSQVRSWHGMRGNKHMMSNRSYGPWLLCYACCISSRLVRMMNSMTRLSLQNHRGVAMIPPRNQESALSTVIPLWHGFR